MIMHVGHRWARGSEARVGDGEPHRFSEETKR